MEQCPDCWRSGDERTGCNCQTVTPDTEPHVHHESEAALWWAEAFPQMERQGRQ
jgi:hypothetical protein